MFLIGIVLTSGLCAYSLRMQNYAAASFSVVMLFVAYSIYYMKESK